MKNNKLSEGIMIKVLSVALAITLWVYVQGKQPQAIHEGIQTFDVEIQWSTDPGHVVTAATSRTAEITLAGSIDSVNLTNEEDIIIDLDLTNYAKGRHTVGIRPKIPAGTRILSTIPKEIDIVLDIWEEKTMEVELEFLKELPDNAIVLEENIEPKEIVVSGAASVIDDIDKVVAEYDYTVMGESEENITLKAKNTAGVTLTSVNIDDFVDIEVVIKYSKSLPVKLNELIEVPEDMSLRVQPLNVIVIADKEPLEQIEYIETEYFDIGEITEEKFEVNLVYPENMKAFNEKHETVEIIIN